MSAMSGKKIAFVVEVVVLLYLGSYLALRPFAVEGESDFPQIEKDLSTWTSYPMMDSPYPKQGIARASGEAIYMPLLSLDRLLRDSKATFEGANQFLVLKLRSGHHSIPSRS